MRNDLLLLSLIAIVGSCGTLLADDASLPDFTYIHMLDRNIGWAETSSAILRTTDGAKTWKELEPADGVDIGTGVGWRNGDFALPDPHTAWIADVKQETSIVSLLHTVDGGKHWTHSTLTLSDTDDLLKSHISFPDASHGWLLLQPQDGMNSLHGYLYGTTDGGQTWNKVATTNDRLPRAGQSIFATPRPAGSWALR